MYVGLVRTSWFIGCLLVGFLGLIPGFASASTITNTKTEAHTACLNSSQTALSNGAIESRCFFKDLTPRTTSTTTTYGGYFCIQRRGSGTSFTVRYCDKSTSSIIGSFSGGSAQNNSIEFYNNYNLGATTTVTSALGLDDFSSFFWATTEDVCLNAPDVDPSPFHAPTQSLTGDVCHNGCAYLIATAYIGTWPSGHVEFSAYSLKRACTSEDSPSTSEPIPKETPPLDIPGETPDKVPDPSDGTSGNSSSGGGSCDSAPVCSGDAIQCNILYQTWATRCSNTKGGDGSGDGSGNGSGNGDGQNIVDAVNGVGNKVDGLSNKMSDIFGDGSEDANLSGFVSDEDVTADMFDSSGWGFSRSCPLQTSRQITAGPLNFDIDLTIFCSILSWSGYLIVAIGSFLAVYIVLRSQ